MLLESRLISKRQCYQLSQYTIKKKCKISEIEGNEGIALLKYSNSKRAQHLLGS